MKKTQLEQIKEQLLNNGEVTRNWALQNYIGRLASRMDDLKKEGWEFETYFRKTEHGQDFVYKLKKANEKTLHCEKRKDSSLSRMQLYLF